MILFSRTIFQRICSIICIKHRYSKRWWKGDRNVGSRLISSLECDTVERSFQLHVSKFLKRRPSTTGNSFPKMIDTRYLEGSKISDFRKLEHARNFGCLGISTRQGTDNLQLKHITDTLTKRFVCLLSDLPPTAIFIHKNENNCLFYRQDGGK